MKTYYIPYKSLLTTTILPELKNCLEAPFQVWADERLLRIVVKTDTKPKDIPMAGIYWKETDDAIL